MAISQWYETTLVDQGSALAASFLAVPFRALSAQKQPLSVSTVASRLELDQIQRVPSVALPVVLTATLLLVEQGSFLALLQKRRTEEGWNTPHDLLVTREFRFAEHLAFAPVVPFAHAPLRLQSLAGLAGTAMGGELGAYVGFARTGSTPVVFTTGPAGIVICGAAAGMARALEQGLRDRILRLITGADMPREAPVPAQNTSAAPEPSASVQQREQQSEDQAALESPVVRDNLKDGSPGPEMVVIPTGSFIMGSSQQEDEGPPHQVTIARSFAMGKYTVTFSEYDRFAQSTGRDLPDDSGWGRNNQPVVNVCWEDAVAYAEWLSEQTGKRYRLPTEAEWEYAARAGTQSAYWWGDEIGRNRANCDGCGSEWDDSQPAPVGSFAPNPFGLHDMLGNVWEWVEDCWHDDYNGAPADGSAWLSEDGGPRGVRGGSWAVDPAHLRSALRYGASAEDQLDSLGFRLVQNL